MNIKTTQYQQHINSFINRAFGPQWEAMSEALRQRITDALAQTLREADTPTGQTDIVNPEKALKAVIELRIEGEIKQSHAVRILGLPADEIHRRVERAKRIKSIDYPTTEKGFTDAITF